jgi:integrase
MPKKISSRHTSHDEAIQPLLPGELMEGLAKNAISTAFFEEYRTKLSDHTLRRQEADLLLFCEFLESEGVHLAGLDRLSSPWRLVTWAQVEAFVKWQVDRGYAIPSINVRLSSIKTYARLAMQSGRITPQEYSLIRSVQGYTYREGARIDQKRPIKRIGLKKAEPIKLTQEQVSALKSQPATPQGRRDTLMMCLLLDHGLKVGDLSHLKLSDFDLSEGSLREEASKSRYDPAQKLTSETLAALQACLDADELIADSFLLRRSKKNEELGEAGMSDRAITGRVCSLGEKLGIANLSSHDCRHHWISSAKNGSEALDLDEGHEE